MDPKHPRLDKETNWIIHGPGVCAGEPCCFHNPSNHHMVKWKKVVRESTLVERICPHGVGHPDPDSLWFFKKQGIESMGVHGCCGCCQLPHIKRGFNCLANLFPPEIIAKLRKEFSEEIRRMNSLWLVLADSFRKAHE